jgi:hypothetical protein
VFGKACVCFLWQIQVNHVRRHTNGTFAKVIRETVSQSFRVLMVLRQVVYLMV